jgi:hypothetical protein
MIGSIEKLVGEVGRTAWRAGLACALLLAVLTAMPAQAWMDTENPVMEMGYNPNGIFILDGSYVMNVGEVQINITNWGLIGSTYSIARPWSDAPSCQWPSGSGNEYLWSAGLWVGGVVLGERLCSSGGFGSEIYPLDELEATIYEAIGTKILRPAGNAEGSGRRAPQPNPNDDNDTDDAGNPRIDEEILNGKDDDGDGLVDEDFAQIGNQMFVLTNYDNTRLAIENFPDHTPMNLEIIQESYQWENDQSDDFVGFDFTINNIGVTDVERVYIGFFADSDIGPRGQGGTADDDMAGSWPTQRGSPGFVRASDGSFVPLQVGYMYDAAEAGRLDGYFGIVFLGHDVDPTGVLAPTSVGMRTFQSFSGNASFEQGGDPTNDDEQYQLLSAPIEEWDNNTIPGRQADFRFLVSAGPFSVLPPGESLTFQVGMVVGPGLDGLLANCAEAFLTWDGIYVDNIPNQDAKDCNETIVTGSLGRETMLCRGDGPGLFPATVFNTFLPDYGDTSCLDPNWVINQPTVSDCDIFEYEVNGALRECAMFNLDNCFECGRQNGRNCEPTDFDCGTPPCYSTTWNCNNPDIADTEKVGCTGVRGAESQINWLVGMAPPPPGLRLWSTDSRVHVFWDDEPEFTPDIRLQQVDFESYRIWRADNWDRPFGSSLVNGPESSLWQMVAEYDLVNSFISYRNVDGVDYLDTIPLGANTGLEVISYTPVALSDSRFAGLADSMKVVVDSDPKGQNSTRPPVRDSEGNIIPTSRPVVRWETYPDVLDTFWAVTPREGFIDPVEPANSIVPKRAVNFYEYVDYDIHNGFIYFYSVTSTDHVLESPGNDLGITLPVGAGLVGDPGSSFSNTQPGAKSQTAEEREKFGVNIYVFPNPATRDALAEYQQLFANGDDPTGVRVTFTNLPAAANTIKIYTVSGDLVQTISHDGTTGTGHVSWNLMSRNGQEIVSGVYLYSVESDDGRFENYVGKFVVVR